MINKVHGLIRTHASSKDAMIENFNELLKQLKQIEREAASVIQNIPDPGEEPPQWSRGTESLRQRHAALLIEVTEVQKNIHRVESRVGLNGWLRNLIDTICGRPQPSTISLSKRKVEIEDTILDVGLSLDGPERDYSAIADRNNVRRSDILAARSVSAKKKAVQEEIIAAARGVEAEIKESFLTKIRGKSFTLGFNEGLTKVLSRVRSGDRASAIKLLHTTPVRRIASPDQDQIFVDFASKELSLWRTRKNKGVHHPDGSAEVRAQCVSDLRRYIVGKMVSADFDTLEDRLTVPGFLERDVQALLYWIATEAERETYLSFPAKVYERDFNRILPERFAKTAQTKGHGLFRALGYEGEFPFEVGYFEIDQTNTETASGADLAILIHITLENGDELNLAGLFQGKTVGADFLGDVWSKPSKRFGKNHQLVAMVDAGPLAHYLFYHDPASVVGISARPASAIANDIRQKLKPEQKIWEISQANAKVSSISGATSFASLIAFGLFGEGHVFESLSGAIESMGRAREGFQKGTGTSSAGGMAKRTLLFSVGARIRNGDEQRLREKGFIRRSDDDLLVASKFKL